MPILAAGRSAQILKELKEIKQALGLDVNQDGKLFTDRLEKMERKHNSGPESGNEENKVERSSMEIDSIELEWVNPFTDKIHFGHEKLDFFSFGYTLEVFCFIGGS